MDHVIFQNPLEPFPSHSIVRKFDAPSLQIPREKWVKIQGGEDGGWKASGAKGRKKGASPCKYRRRANLVEGKNWRKMDLAARRGSVEGRERGTAKTVREKRGGEAKRDAAEQEGGERGGVRIARMERNVHRGAGGARRRRRRDGNRRSALNLARCIARRSRASAARPLPPRRRPTTRTPPPDVDKLDRCTSSHRLRRLRFCFRRGLRPRNRGQAASLCVHPGRELVFEKAERGWFL